jgi:hypothetical protein
VYSTLQHIVNKHLKKHQAFNKSNHMWIKTTFYLKPLLCGLM